MPDLTQYLILAACFGVAVASFFFAILAVQVARRLGRRIRARITRTTRRHPKPTVIPMTRSTEQEIAGLKATIAALKCTIRLQDSVVRAQLQEIGELRQRLTVADLTIEELRGKWEETYNRVRYNRPLPEDGLNRIMADAEHGSEHDDPDDDPDDLIRIPGDFFRSFRRSPGFADNIGQMIDAYVDELEAAKQTPVAADPASRD